MKSFRNYHNVIEVKLFVTKLFVNFHSKSKSELEFSLFFLGDPSWESGKARLHGLTEDNLSEVSASAAHVSHDGKHSLLEFEMRSVE